MLGGSCKKASQEVGINSATLGDVHQEHPIIKILEGSVTLEASVAMAALEEQIHLKMRQQ